MKLSHAQLNKLIYAVQHDDVVVGNRASFRVLLRNGLVSEKWKGASFGTLTSAGKKIARDAG